ncbi:MAG TPA: M1 family peptidase [Bacteroidetes bacterium]|nr:M1 family peptidase [Bacteroidota bacterium]
MRTKVLLSLLLFFATNIGAQENAYFQQHVDYKINVSLDDEKHTISGDIEIAYTNHAPHALDSIYFHFWGNAFKTTGSAFGKQKLRTGSTKFYFSPKKSRGYYSNLDFSVDGQKADLMFDKNNPDIAVLLLPEAVGTGETILIKSPFSLKIPDSFSRLGHVGTSYQMTQWYPKPAVYDRKGWHPMPYLDLGEFYSEFGNFDVSITLPDNYVVGASGVLQTASEIGFLKNKIAETEALAKKGFPVSEDFPASSPTTKTIRYVAENVHDFAWFADKRFHVLKGEAKLGSGKKVDTWAMFTNGEAEIWEKGAEYVARAVEFYSVTVGEYPWPQATAVHSALSAGGGMEYPMITVIGDAGSAKLLDDVITHEVGHNWFYGILASNERDHAWMDEGMNSYYEYRYMRRYHGQRVGFEFPAIFLNHSPEDLYELAYLFNARRNMDQPCDLTSDGFTEFNYGISAYVKPGTAMGHLEQYLGTGEYDRIMQLYFEKWKFKHPYPEDFRQLVETESGKDLSWFFDGYLYSNKKLDYAIAGIEEDENGFDILIKNKGEIAAPFPISGMKNEDASATKWFEGFKGEQTIHFPKGEYDKIVLDAENVTLDVNRKNNFIKTSGPLKKMEPLRLGFLGAAENSSRSTLNVWPAAGYNKYDGAMFGLALHNGLLPAKNLEWQLAPMFGFGSKDVAGLANVNYNIFPKQEKIKKISFGISAKRFSFRSLDSLRSETGFASTHLQYQRLVPSVKVELRRSLTSRFYQTLQFRSIFGNEESTDFEPVDTLGVFYVGNSNKGRTINQLSWEIGNKRALNPFSFRLVFEHQNSNVRVLSSDTARFEKQHHLKASFELKTSYTYDKGRSFDVRIFVGKFFQSSDRTNAFSYYDEAFSLTGEGFNDYRYDELYFGRSEPDGLLSRQISQREGGLKVPLGNSFGGVAGRSNSFLFAVNIIADLPQDLPGKLPLRPYFDLGYYGDKRPIASDLQTSDRIWWQGGVTLDLFKGAFAIHFPAVNSSKVKDLYNQSGRSSFFKRISFNLDIYKLNPWKMVNVDTFDL